MRDTEDFPLRRHPPRRRAACVVLAGVLLLALAACTSDTGRTGPATIVPTAAPSPTRWVPALSYEEAYRRLPPLEGTEPTVLHWRLPDLDDARREAALLAMRRFIALEEDDNRLAPYRPYADAYLYWYVATQEYADRYVGYSEIPASTPFVGPLWYWVMDLRPRADDEVDIDVCVDIGWWVSEPRDTPRVERVEIRTYHMKLVTDGDSEPRWKVDAVNPSSKPRLGQEMADQCERWAVHTPEGGDDG